jgi:hypothetical protein
MSTRYSFAATAALLLSVSFGGSPAAATGNDPVSVEACTTGKNVVFRAAGHPGKSPLLPQREIMVAGQCTDSAGQRLMLVTFTDAPGGEALLAGNADRAIRQLTEQAPGRDATLVFNNLCVAHTALRQWPEARLACDAAVNAAANRKVAGSSERRRLANKVAAAVYSNRAVMNWLSLDAVAAQGDFAQARSIAPKASFVLRNAELAMRLPARVEYGNLPIG